MSKPPTQDEINASMQSAKTFIAEIVLPAFHQIKKQMDNDERTAVIEDGGINAHLLIKTSERTELDYYMYAFSEGRAFAEPVVRSFENGKAVDSNPPFSHHDITKATQQDIVNHVNEQYRQATIKKPR